MKIVSKLLVLSTFVGISFIFSIYTAYGGENCDAGCGPVNTPGGCTNYYPPCWPSGCPGWCMPTDQGPKCAPCGGGCSPGGTSCGGCNVSCGWGTKSCTDGCSNWSASCYAGACNSAPSTPSRWVVDYGYQAWTNVSSLQMGIYSTDLDSNMNNLYRYIIYYNPNNGGWYGYSSYYGYWASWYSYFANYGSSAYTYTTMSVPDGVYYHGGYAYDNYGAWSGFGGWYGPYYRDGTGPSSWTNLVSGGTYSTVVPVTVSGVDRWNPYNWGENANGSWRYHNGSGLSQIKVYIDGVEKYTHNGGDYSSSIYSLDTRTLTNGSHRVQTYARDNAGNWRWWEDKTIIVANNPPTVTNVSPAGNSTLSTGTTSVTLTANATFNTLNGTRVAEIWARRQGGAYSRICQLNPAGDGNFSCNYSGLTSGSTYNWYAMAINESSTVSSSAWNFTILNGIQGWIWDSTGVSCSDDKSSRELQPSDVNGGSISTYVTGTPNISGTWNPSGFSSYSYEVNGVPSGDQTVCTASFQPNDTPNFIYVLQCLNNGTSGVISGSCALVNISSSPTRADLGYKLISNGWISSADGDVYGGCPSCSYSVSVGIPDITLGGFQRYLISGKGTVFGNSDISVEDASGSNRYSEDSNRYVKEINADEGDVWPSSYNFEVPSDRETIATSCTSFLKNSTLEPSKVYELDTDCMQRGIDNLGGGGYKLDLDGVVVLYVTGNDTLTFGDGSDLFRSSNSNQRIIIVTEAPIVISKDLGSAAPASSDRPQIEAMLITQSGITFESNTPAEDTTVILEGPIVSKDGGILFNRNRLVNNSYPAVVIKYNPLYMDKLAEQERDSSRVNYTGLFLNDISWNEEN